MLQLKRTAVRMAAGLGRHATTSAGAERVCVIELVSDTM